MPESYYEPPTYNVFEDLKKAICKLHEHFYQGIYLDDKIRQVNRTENVKDNFMHLISQLDLDNQIRLVELIEPETKQAIYERLVDIGNESLVRYYKPDLPIAPSSI